MTAPISLTKLQASLHNPNVSIGNLHTYKSKSRIEVTCTEHGSYITYAAEFLKSPLNCKSCSMAAEGVKKRLKFEEVVARANEVHNHKYTYNQLDYSTKRAVLHYKCPEHGSIMQVVDKHLDGQGCSICGNLTAGINRRRTLSEIITLARATHGNRYEYIDVTWPTPGKDGILTVKCNEHGEFKQRVNTHLKSKVGCIKCYRDSRKGVMKFSLSELADKSCKIHDNKYTYTNLTFNADQSRNILTINCPKHGEFIQRANDHLSGHGCPSCSNRISKPAQEISTFLASLGISLEMEYTFPGTRKAFDIAVHEHKLVIEYNSNYWHSSQFLPSNYHVSKSKLAQANGYRCIHIHGNDWQEKQAQVKAILQMATGKVKDKIYARKCEIVTPTTNETRTFLNSNHIQGYTKSLNALGLKYNDELVAIMGFTYNTSNRNAKSDPTHVELARYATSKHVPGGFSKLLKTWLKQNPEVKTVVSFSDNSIFVGNTYAKNGFKLIETLQPDYKYREPGNSETLCHKSNYTKARLINRFGVGKCEGKTEKQITEEAGIYRVYNCGKMKWIYST